MTVASALMVCQARRAMQERLGRMVGEDRPGLMGKWDFLGQKDLLESQDCLVRLDLP